MGSGASLLTMGTITSSIVDNGTITAHGGKLILSGAVSGGGSLVASGTNTLDLTAGEMLTESISGSGTLELGNSYTSSASQITTGSILIDAVGSLSGAGTYSNAVNNKGTITDNGGTMTFLDAVTNSGTIGVASGLISFTNTVATTSGGTLAVGAAGTLSLLNGTGGGQHVDFTTSGGLLDLTNQADFLGFIAGLGGSDLIDLVGTAYTGYTFASGTLTVTNNGATVAGVRFSGGTLNLSSFSLSADNHGGTLIAFA